MPSVGIVLSMRFELLELIDLLGERSSSRIVGEVIVTLTAAVGTLQKQCLVRFVNERVNLA